MNIEKLKTIPFFKNQPLQYAFDSLTKVLSRELIITYINSLVNEGKHFSLCLCDVDNFKHVNDTYGHMKGDEVLSTFAQVIEKAVGNNGVVGRYGGDEFIIVLDTTEYNDVWSVCHNINKEASNVVFNDLDELVITLTTGISRFPIDGSTYTDIIHTADKALYRGKMKGRNCFIIYLAAKHSNIMLRTANELSYSSMEQHTRIFNILNNPDNSLKDNIEALLNYLSLNLMIDHLGIQDENDNLVLSVVHQLSKVKEFKGIENKLYSRDLNQSGLAFYNHRRTIAQTNNKAYYQKLEEQGIYSLFVDKISIASNDFGCLRADSCSTRIWQNSEMDLLVTASKLIAVVLNCHKLKLSEVFK